MILLGPLSQIYPVVESMRDLARLAVSEYPQLARDAREQQMRWDAFAEILRRLGIRQVLGRAGSVEIRLMGPDEFLRTVSPQVLERVYRWLEELVTALNSVRDLLGDPYVLVSVDENGPQLFVLAV